MSWANTCTNGKPRAGLRRLGPVMPITIKAYTKTRINRVLNLLLMLSGGFLVGTGWVLDERLPRGQHSRHLTLLGWDRHHWGDVHAWLGYVLVALVAVHLALHSAWLWKVAAGAKPWKLVTGFGATAVIIGLLAFYPISGN